MFQSYLTTALRTIKRDPLHAFINVGGLAIGLAVCMLILLFVRDELAFDTWIKDADRIANTEIQFNVPNRNPVLSSRTPGPVASNLAEYFPNEIEAVTRIYNPSDTIIIEGKEYAETISYVDSSFFNVFDLEMITGNREQAVTDATSILLNENMAFKFFGDDNAVGQTFTIRQSGSYYDYTVAGVFKNLPNHTHLFIQIIAKIEMPRYDKTKWLFHAWTSTNTYTYVKFNSVKDMKIVQDNLPNFVADRAELNLPAGMEDIKAKDLIELNLIPITDIYLSSKVNDYNKALGNMTTVLAFSAIAMLILLIAAINFMNLAIAKSLQRAREVCIRKVMGAKKRQLIAQFIGEAIIMTITSLMLALMLVELALPSFNAFTQKAMELALINDPVQTLGLFGLAIITGLVGGSYPAFVISRFRPAKVLRSNKSTSSGSSLLRQSLVVFQFTISIVLLISTTIIYQQTKYVQNVDLGFDKEQRYVLSGMLRGDMHLVGETIKTQFLALPEVKEAAFSSDVIPQRNHDNDSVKTLEMSEALLSEILRVDFKFFETYGVVPLAGRTFSKDFLADEYSNRFKENGHASIIVNNSFLGKTGIESPEKAIGKSIQINGQSMVTIVGVVPDLRSNSAMENVNPTFYALNSKPQIYLTLALDTDDMVGTLAKLEKIWANIVPIRPLFGTFVDDNINALYAEDEQRSQMFGVFALFAVFVACLGLYGLASFSAAIRTKEIGLRKVMGASIPKIVNLMAWQFSKPVVIANLIAWPTAWYFMTDWLNGFVFRMDISPLPFLMAGGLALIVSWLTVSTHAYRVARSNPISALRAD